MAKHPPLVTTYAVLMGGEQYKIDLLRCRVISKMRIPGTDKEIRKISSMGFGSGLPREGIYKEVGKRRNTCIHFCTLSDVPLDRGNRSCGLPGPTRWPPVYRIGIFPRSTQTQAEPLSQWM